MLRYQQLRQFASAASKSPKIDPSKYKLTCGLEIHAQLMTPQKLFSAQNTGSLHAPPNSQVSFYDAALPGTQPLLNPNNVFLALRAAVALGCSVAPRFSFDRKHYFYGDQPAGYQITQHFEPYATDGLLTLYARDLSDGKKRAAAGAIKDVNVRIKQIQIEQDTGKSMYIDDTANIDLNRTNHCLIEMVTEPDIPTPEAAGIFVRKLQQLLAHLGVCTGELESGAMRVDVNVSVSRRTVEDTWELGERCEIKNLSTTSAVVHAIRAEFSRQVADVEAGREIERETRGWDGRRTWKLRSKEDGVDYRYMPDPEVLPVELEPDVVERVTAGLPELPDAILQRLLAAPYNVPLRDARTLMAGGEEKEDTSGEVPQRVLGQAGTLPVVEYYEAVFARLAASGAETRLAANWIVHTLLGELKTLGRTAFVEGQTVPSAAQFGDLLAAVSSKELTAASGKLVLKHLLQNPQATATRSIEEIVEEFELARAPMGGSAPGGGAGSEDDVAAALREVCSEIMAKSPKIVEQITSGKKPKSIQFLIGQVMRETQGRVDPQAIEVVFKELLGLK